MAKKTTDPFMAALWSALIADKLGPAGHETAWDETPVRIRNRFIRAVRPVLQSGAAFQASALELRAPARAAPAKTGAKTGGKRKGKQHAAGELQLPLMTGMKRGRE